MPFASYESVCAEVPDGGVPFDLLMGSKPPAKRVTVAFTSKSVRPSASDTPGLGFTAYVTASEVGLRREVFHLPFGGDPYQCCTKGGPSALTFSCMLSGVDQIESRGKVSRQGNAIVLEWCTANLSTRRVSSGSFRLRCWISCWPSGVFAKMASRAGAVVSDMACDRPRGQRGPEGRRKRKMTSFSAGPAIIDP